MTERLADHREVDGAPTTLHREEPVWFRFNRRTSRSRGLVFHVLGLAVGDEPVRYRDLVVDPRPKRNPPAGRAGWGHPPSLERPPANRP